MNILDEVQEEVRDPRYSDHVSRGSETGLADEHWYEVHGSWVRDAVLRADAWLETEAASRILRHYIGKCILVSGEDVVACGDTWEDAYRSAVDRGIRACETIALRMSGCIDHI